MLVQEHAGWPMLAMSATYVTNTNFDPGQLKWGIALPRSRVGRGVPAMLPLRPAFPGFLVNTLFYTLIWALLLGPGWRFVGRPLRRRWRARGGRCPVCRYPLGELTTCPECGDKTD